MGLGMHRVAWPLGVLGLFRVWHPIRCGGFFRMFLHVLDS